MVALMVLNLGKDEVVLKVSLLGQQMELQMAVKSVELLVSLLGISLAALLG
jgi:hypothetical protein